MKPREKLESPCTGAWTRWYAIPQKRHLNDWSNTSLGNHHAEQMVRICVDLDLKMILMGIRLIPGASWGLFVCRCLMHVRGFQNVFFIVLHVEHIIMEDRFIGGDSLREKSFEGHIRECGEIIHEQHSHVS